MSTRALLIRSIPLSNTTTNAWREAGAMFVKRSRPLSTIPDVALGRMVLNLGNQAYDPYQHAPKTWNISDDIKVLLSTTASEELFSLYTPCGEYSSGVSDYWIKGPGRAGRNKRRISVSGEGDFNWHKRMLPGGYIIQQHIPGQEYRVITVGSKVVQSSARFGQNGDRRYEWVGLQGTPTRVKDMARSAAHKLSGKNVVGWDIIDSNDDAPYLLEGNSCPGVNAATANRILNEMERQEQA